MKKIIALFFALLLPLCAGAETIAQQISAPETYQAEYCSNTKRTKITVDATVYVPDVEIIPTYAVSVRDFTVEEGMRLTKLLHPDMEWNRWSSEGDTPYEELSFYRSGNNQYESTNWRVSLPKPYSAYVTLHNGYTVGIFNRQPDERYLKYRWKDPETNLFFYASSDFADAKTIGQSLNGQTLTVDEATAIANDFMANMAPDYEFRTVFGVQGETGGNGKFYHTLAYCFCYTRTVSDVPITYAAHANISTEFVDAAMAPAPGQELITVVIHENRIVSFHWQDPYELGEIILTEAALLPFEEIMSIFGSVAPLSIQSTENDTGSKSKANNGMHITEVRLGYMPVLCKDDPNQWELRPVWDFMGSRILPLATYNYPCYSLLTIDAIDGTVIDRSYGY